MQHGNRYYHHSTNLTELPCAICNEHFKMYWKDAEEQNGFSDTTSMKDNKKVHYFCIPGAKSLHELNKERKQERKQRAIDKIKAKELKRIKKIGFKY